MACALAIRGHANVWSYPWSVYRSAIEGLSVEA